MKKLFFLLILIPVMLSCHREDYGIDDFRQAMRDFVIGISGYAKSTTPGFIVIPQNGIELVTVNGEENGEPESDYLSAIDGNGQEDLFYGYESDNEATPSDENRYLRSFLDISRDAGNIILVTDYCSSPAKMDNSYEQNQDANYVSFAASHRELDNIPTYPVPVFAENAENIIGLEQIKNFLYLINPENFTSRTDFINSVTGTNYDLLIMDLFFNDGSAFSASEISQLRNKANGGKRLVIAYMSIGEAEDYRYYWKKEWNKDEPSWMGKENPEWEGNYKVRYWDKNWQDIIFGNDDSYLKKILDAGFDGVYLDIIDAFEYFENK